MTPPLLYAAGRAPRATLDMISGGGNVLLLAPHPDDESLGCGGAIAALTAAGQRVQVVVVTDGGHSHPGSHSHPRESLARLRAQEVTRAVDLLTGGTGPEPILLGYPDNAAPDGAEAAAAAAARIIPYLTQSVTAIWTSWDGDPHPDHGRTARIATTICAQTPGMALWSYPIWGRFRPDACDLDPDALVQFDTDGWQDCKAAAIAAHASQMTDLIKDDPSGFQMDSAMQSHFITTPELFIRTRAD